MLSDSTHPGSKRDQALARVLLAETYAVAGRSREALAEVRAALELSDDDDIAVPAATILIEADREAEASVIADKMEHQLPRRSRAFGKLLKATSALRRNQIAEGLGLLNEAKALADLWMIRLALGRAYVSAGRHVDALAELEACVKRAGEAAAIYLNDVPSYRVTVPLKYWLARAHEGLAADARKRNGGA
jgi:tetratricopeptide (TPR) repeat protein